MPEDSILAGLWSDADYFFMARALDLAREAAIALEVPVGAVLVSGGKIVGEGRNRPVVARDPTCHAEIEALRQGCKANANYRMPGSTLYVTLEPCVMCAGALVIARVERLVYAARDLRFGAVRSKFCLADSEILSHRIRVEEGLLAADSGALLSAFFQERR